MTVQTLLLKKLKNEFKLATGCTDPAAIAAAVARAGTRLDHQERHSVQKIEVSLSANIFKNGYMVDIPGTSEKGLPIAAALGLVIGRPQLGFEIFRHLQPSAVLQAKEWVAHNKVVIKQIEDGTSLTINVRLLTPEKEVEVLVKNDYLNTCLVKENGLIVQQQDSSVSESLFEQGVRFADLVQFTETVPAEELSFMEEGLEINARFVAEGERHPQGLQLGRTLREQFGAVDDVGMQIRMKTASGVDARMGGSTLPVMSSAGSGNLGLGASVPLLMLKKQHDLSVQTLWRGMALANLIHVYTKELTGRLTSVCGGVLVAMGTSAAMVWMLGGGLPDMERAIRHVAANVTGMICDGANYGCSFKVSTTAAEAYYAAVLALHQRAPDAAVGLVAADIEQTIANVIDIFVNMNQVDPAILQAMSK